MISDKDLYFIKKKFAGKKDLSGISLWKHAERTAHYFEKTVKKFNEINKHELRDLTLAALGHDLLEDTMIGEEEINKKWGEESLFYIKMLTNFQGDKNFNAYIEKLKKAPEKVLLIKLADIHSNIANSIERFNKFDPWWFKNFWLPLLKRYKKELFNRIFVTYPKTGQNMIGEINIKIKELDNLLSNFKKRA